MAQNPEKMVHGSESHLTASLWTKPKNLGQVSSDEVRSG